MGLIGDIRKIDPKFAAAIEGQKSAKDVLAASPWAWFTFELKRIFPNVHPSAHGIPRIDLDSFANVELGYRKPNIFFSQILSKRFSRFAFGSNLLFDKKEKPLARFFLELHGTKETKPLWFKLIEYVSKDQKPFTRKEIIGDLRLNFALPGNFKPEQTSPKIFDYFIHVEYGGRGSETFYSIKKESYDKIIAPLKPWLTPNGFKVFEKWKQKYHWGRQID